MRTKNNIMSAYGCAFFLGRYSDSEITECRGLDMYLHETNDIQRRRSLISRFDYSGKKESFAGQYSSQDTDPNLTFTIRNSFAGGAIVWFELRNTGAPFLNPCVYLDCGNGFNESTRVPLQRFGDVWYIEVFFIDGLASVRLDPSEAPCDFSLVACGVTAIGRDSKIFDTVGLSSLQSVNIDLNLLSGQAVFTTVDPQLRFSLNSRLRKSDKIYLRCRFKNDSSRSFTPRLYLDDVEGHSIPLIPVSAGEWVVALIGPRYFETLRLDLIEDFGSCTLLELSAFEELGSLSGYIDGNEAASDRVDALQRSALVNLQISRSFIAFDAEVVDQSDADGMQIDPYHEWFQRHAVSPAQRLMQQRISGSWSKSPVFSIIVPVYKVTSLVFAELVQSVLDQSYQNWELCISLAYLDDDDLVATVRCFAAQDERILLVELENNLGISGNSKEAFQLSSGDYLVLLDHDDLITPDALFEMAKAIRKRPGVDFLYSDKDMMNDDGTLLLSPLFKPEWSPDIMLNANYLTHFNAIKRERFLEVGGWDALTDGAQDWDLFARVIGTNCEVVHIPRVLYHWRMVETSVAHGGIATKPYAAAAQLLAVDRFLAAQGFEDAKAEFATPDKIQVRWSPDFKPKVLLIRISTSPDQPLGWDTDMESFEIDIEHHVLLWSADMAGALNSIIATSSADVVVIAPAALNPLSNWIDEMVGPLENQRINIVTGKLLGRFSDLVDCGWISVGGEMRSIFRGLTRYQYTVIGSVEWYRNVDASSFGGMSFRKDVWQVAGHFKNGLRPDLEFSARVSNLNFGRIMYNPYAESWIDDARFEDLLSVRLNLEEAPEGIAFQNRNFNRNLQMSSAGDIAVKSISSQHPASPPHDYSSEGMYAAQHFDFLSSDIKTHEEIAGPDRQKFTLGRLCWIVPDFNMPFYGGIHTILRASEYLRVVYDVCPVFVVLGASSVEAVRRSIALAFPELAKSCDIFTLGADEDINAIGLGHLDAAICTLWTTAYKLLRLEQAGKKFYFMQDYEPLFYPAGSTSGLVEATYKFGFTAICNTEPLAKLYEKSGGTADFFWPAIDSSVFYKGRQDENEGPCVLFSYARPGHPRNCFELLARGMKEAKDYLGDRLVILTAGADWDVDSFDLGGVVEHLGLLTYKETGELYRACDIGMVAMATRHPSYLPLELMACGAVVLTNKSEYTDWLLQDNENAILFELSKSCVRDAIVKAVESKELRKRISHNASSTIIGSYSNWKLSCESIYQILIADSR